jgi:phosphoribosylformimino-5-aminoimidazole carboxamide ribotide isomerase
MELWAAIDLMGGSVVTLVQGKASDKTVWKEEPERFARKWEADGAHGIHVVDLDAAFGKGSNRDWILKIVASVSIPVEVGGGIRNESAARSWLDEGVERIVVGTMAYREPAVLARLLGAYGPERVVVAADYRDGEIVTKGWQESQGVGIGTAAERMEKAGVKNLLATCVGRDGMGTGPDVDTIRTLVNLTKMNVIASGGIRDISDIKGLKRAGASGAIIGRALYEGTVKLTEAKRSVD